MWHFFLKKENDPYNKNYKYNYYFIINKNYKDHFAKQTKIMRKTLKMKNSLNWGRTNS